MDLFIGQGQLPTPITKVEQKSTKRITKNISEILPKRDYSYDDVLQKAILLDKQRDEAIIAKRKREVIDRAIKVAEEKHKTIYQLVNSKDLKQNFEVGFAQNPFSFKYQNNPQIQPVKQSNAMPYGQNPYVYYQMHYQQQLQQQQQQSQAEMQRIKEQQMQAQQKAAQEALEQLKIMQLEPMRQLQQLQTLQEKLSYTNMQNPQGQVFNQFSSSTPSYNQYNNPYYGQPLQQQIQQPNYPVYPQQVIHQKYYVENPNNRSMEYGHVYQDSPKLDNKYINIQRPQSHNLSSIQNNQEQDYMESLLNLKYQPNQHKDTNIRGISDFQTMNQQQRDFQALDKRKKRLILEYQNLKKKDQYANKANQSMEQRQILKQNDLVTKQEEDIQTSLAQQQKLIMQLVNEMTNKKEEDIRVKNQQLMNKIKKYESKNKKIKNQVNKTLLTQLAGGDNQLNNLEKIYLKPDFDEQSLNSDDLQHEEINDQ